MLTRTTDHIEACRTLRTRVFGHGTDPCVCWCHRPNRALVPTLYKPSAPRTGAQLDCDCETLIEYPVEAPHDPTHRWALRECPLCRYQEIGRYIATQDRPDVDH